MGSWLGRVHPMTIVFEYTTWYFSISAGFCDFSWKHIPPRMNSSSSSNDSRFTRLILTLDPRLDHTNHWSREIGNPELEVLSAEGSNLPPKTPGWERERERETWFMAKHSPSHVGAPNVEDNSCLASYYSWPTLYPRPSLFLHPSAGFGTVIGEILGHNRLRS